MKFVRKFFAVSAASVLAAAVVVAGPGVSVMAQTWSPVIDRNGPGGADGSESQITVDVNGLATAVWRSENGDHDIVKSSTSLNGAVWTDPVSISDGEDDASSPKVTVALDGRATAVWTANTGNGEIVQASSSVDGGVWSAPVTISADEPGVSFYGSRVVVDEDGLVTAVWLMLDENENIGAVQSATSFNGETWSGVVDVTDATDEAKDPNITVDASGLATAVWYSIEGGVRIVKSSTSQNGAAWSVVQNLSVDSHNSQDPRVTTDGSGLATAVWVRAVGPNNVLETRSSQSGGAWSDVVSLTTTGFYPTGVQIAVDLNGLRTAVWSRYDGSIYVIQVSTSTDGASWTPVETLTDTWSGSIQVAADANGLTTLIWASGGVVQSSASQDGGAWSDVVDVSTVGIRVYQPQLATSVSGRAVSIWQTDGVDRKTVQSANALNGAPWSAVADLTVPGDDFWDAQITVDMNGLATAVWMSNTGASDVVQSSTSFRGEAWSAVVDLSATGEEARHPQVAVDANGLATAIWARYDGEVWVVQSRTSLNGAAWSDVVDLFTGFGALEPQITADENGLATAVWINDAGPDNIVQSSTSLNGAAWSEPISLSAEGQDAQAPQITVDANGLATAIWARYDDNEVGVVQSRASLNGGAWSDVVDLSAPGSDSLDAQITTNATGLATAIWVSSVRDQYVASSTSLNGGDWSDVVNLTDQFEYSGDPQVTVDANGLATAVWVFSNGDNDIVQSRTLNGGDWSDVVDLSAAGQDAWDPQVTVDGTGLATAVWVRENADGHDIVQSSTSLNGEEWTATDDLSADGEGAWGPQVAVDVSGLATAIWITIVDGSDVVRTSTSQNGDAWTPEEEVSGPTDEAPAPAASALAATGTNAPGIALTGGLSALLLIAGLSLTYARHSKASRVTLVR